MFLRKKLKTEWSCDTGLRTDDNRRYGSNQWWGLRLALVSPCSLSTVTIIDFLFLHSQIYHFAPLLTKMTDVITAATAAERLQELKKRLSVRLQA